MSPALSMASCALAWYSSSFSSLTRTKFMAPVLSFLVSDLVWCTDRGSSVVLALLAYLRGHFNKPLIGFKGQCESLGFV